MASLNWKQVVNHQKQSEKKHGFLRKDDITTFGAKAAQVIFWRTFDVHHLSTLTDRCWTTHKQVGRCWGCSWWGVGGVQSLQERRLLKSPYYLSAVTSEISGQYFSWKNGRLHSTGNTLYPQFNQVWLPVTEKCTCLKRGKSVSGALNVELAR